VKVVKAVWGGVCAAHKKKKWLSLPVKFEKGWCCCKKVAWELNYRRMPSRTRQAFFYQEKSASKTEGARQCFRGQGPRRLSAEAACQEMRFRFRLA